MSNNKEDHLQDFKGYDASSTEAGLKNSLNKKMDQEQHPQNHTSPPQRASSQLDQHKDLERQKTTNSTAPHPDLTLTESHIDVPKGKLHELLFIAVLCMAQFTTQAGLGQAIAPLHIIGKSFGTTSSGQLSWFVAAYSLTVGTFILIAGRLGDIFGHKKFFVAGFLWYGLWSILAGFSVYSDAIFFDCCRALQGIGPAFCLPNSIAILGRTYQPGRKQEMIFSIFGASAPSGFLFGAVFSAIFAQFTWWPWAFWVMGIFCIFLAIAGFFIIPHTPPPVLDKSVSTWKRVDGLGSIIGVAGLVVFNFAWNQGPVVGWPTVYVYVLLIVGCIIMGLFAFIESRAEFALLPSDIFTSNTGFVLACIATGWASFGVWIYYLFLLMEELRDFTPILASGVYAPVALSGLCAALTTGIILSKVPPSMVMIGALLAFTIGGVLVATAPIHQTYWSQTFVAVIIMPWGMDMSFPAATIILSNSMHKEHQGIAASLVNTAINYSISIGLGIAGTVESQVNNGGLTRSDILKGYRGAQYVGIALSTLGLFVALTFGLYERHKKAGL